MAGKQTNLFKRGKTYWIRYKVNGKLIRKSLGLTNKQEAEKEKNRILDSLRGLKTELDFIHAKEKAQDFYKEITFPVSVLWDEFEKVLKRNGSSPDTIQRYKFRINQLTDWLNNSDLEIYNLADITDSVAIDFADWLSNTGISNKTYNESLNALARSIDTFREKAGIINNPFRKDNLPRKNKNPISRKEFSEIEAKAILNSFNTIQIKHKNELEVLFYLGIFSGLRLKDACLLKWESINFDRNTISVVPYKTKKYGTFVIIPLHPDLREILYKAQEWRENEYVLPELAAGYNKYREYTRNLITKVLEFNGYVTSKEKTGGDARKQSACLYGFHSLRYTFVSVCAKAGVPAILVQSIVGHGNPAMTAHYTRLPNDYRQQQINKLSIGTMDQKAELRKSINEKLYNATEEELNQILEILNNK